MQNADQRNTEWLRDGTVITKSSAIEINKVKMPIKHWKNVSRPKMTNL